MNNNLQEQQHNIRSRKRKQGIEVAVLTTNGEVSIVKVITKLPEGYYIQYSQGATRYLPNELAPLCFSELPNDF